MSENYMQKPSQQSSKDKAGPAKSNIITLTGNNSFSLKQRLDELTSVFVAKHGELALERIDGEEVDLQAILEAVQSLPFLTDRKMVVVRNLSQNPPAAEAVEQIISSINNTTDLVFYEPLTDKRTTFYKTLKTKTQFEEFAELDASALAKWLVGEAKNQGGELNLNDANYLVERIGMNQAMLASDLDKLVIYNPQINRADIDLLTENTPQSKIFELLDAVFGGNKARALELYQQQRAQKLEPQAILAMITWQLHLLALAKISKGRSAPTIAKDAGLSPYPVTKALGLAKKLDEQQLKTMVADALYIDRLSKTKPIDLDEALKTYIVTL